MVVVKWKLCFQDFPRFYALRQHKNTQHVLLFKTTKVDPDDIINEIDITNLRQELRSCEPFLVDSELEPVRQKVFHYARENQRKNCGGKA